MVPFRCHPSPAASSKIMTLNGELKALPMENGP